MSTTQATREHTIYQLALKPLVEQMELSLASCEGSLHRRWAYALLASDLEGMVVEVVVDAHVDDAVDEHDALFPGRRG